MSDPTHKCYSRHAPMESVKRAKKGQKVKYYLSQENCNEKEGKLFYEVYMQSFVLKGN